MITDDMRETLQDLLMFRGMPEELKVRAVYCALLEMCLAEAYPEVHAKVTIMVGKVVDSIRPIALNKEE